MPESYVAIDLETTGFDPTSDRIIEVGAVRFDRDGHAERFRSFVRPGRQIPAAVQALTAISDHDVADAPEIFEILPQLAAFIGERAIVGHNVQFDIAFLAAVGLPLLAPAYDTYELATALLPGASQMQLGAIAAALGIAMPVAHRALADAEATYEVFVCLLERLDALPRAVQLDLLAIAEQSDWSPRALIAAAIARRGGSVPEPPQPLRAAEAALALAGRAELPAPLVPRGTARPISETDVEALFAAAAQRPDLLPGFEPRASQRAMARAVALNITHSGHLAVEAGTGTGKSLAYLLPALLHALRNDDRVVISTHTLNLQEQLALHDLPAAAALVEAHQVAVSAQATESTGQVGGGVSVRPEPVEGRTELGAGSSAGPGLRAAVLKGASNYLCLERWAEVRLNAASRNRSEARLHARIAVWLPETETGELGEIAVPAAERSAWDALSAANNDCLSRRCPYVRDNSCFLLRARARAAAAHVVIVNHALLLANAASGDQVLPPFRHLVIDEAHRLEGVATQQYGGTLSLRELETRIEAAGALVPRLRELAAGGGEARSSAAPLHLAGSEVAGNMKSVADTLGLAAASAVTRIPDLDDALRRFLDDFEDTEGGFAGPARTDAAGGGERQVSITAARRAQPLWGDVEDAAMQLDVTLQYLGDRVANARGALASLPPGAAPALERVHWSLAALAESAASSRAIVQGGLLRADAGRIVWLSDGQQGVRVHVAPLEVADRLAADLYAGRESVTATSATLTAQGSFDFSLDTLGLIEPDTLTVPSPFDYRRAVLAIVVDDIPTPELPGYADAVHRVLASAAEAAQGRTLALFTSHAAVRAAVGALATPLSIRGVNVLAHQVDGSPTRLLRMLVEQPRTLLLGTAAFWEGVDVRGDTLSQIAIARLPFPVPADPIYAGRAALYDDPFNEFALPQAVLRFRQGFGRLIRGGEERGVFLLLDRRVLTRPYGEAFLDALPDCEVVRVPASAVGDAVARWLG